MKHLLQMIGKCGHLIKSQRQIITNKNGAKTWSKNGAKTESKRGQIVVKTFLKNRQPNETV